MERTERATPLTVLLALCLAYAAIFAPLDRFRSHGFDPLAPRPRIVEQMIVAGQFARALPLALELRRSYPNEPEVIYWVAVIHHGLQDSRAEAEAWEDYLRTSATPADACPALPEAYKSMGQSAKALGAYERCVKLSPQNPARLFDLGVAYERAGRTAEALELYQQAAALDPYNPALSRSVASRGEEQR